MPPRTSGPTTTWTWSPSPDPRPGPRDGSTLRLRAEVHPGLTSGLTSRRRDSGRVVIGNGSSSEGSTGMSAVIGVLVGLLVLVRVIGRQVTGSLVTQRSLFLMPV